MALILVIDDQAQMRALVGQTLELAGHEVQFAVDGEEGLRLHRAHPASLVITDLFMPGMDGLDTIRAFTGKFPTVPIIAMTGRPDLGDVMRAARCLGAVRTIAKPFHPPELLALVESVLRTHPSGPAGGQD